MLFDTPFDPAGHYVASAASVPAAHAVGNPGSLSQVALGQVGSSCGTLLAMAALRSLQDRARLCKLLDQALGNDRDRELFDLPATEETP